MNDPIKAVSMVISPGGSLVILYSSGEVIALIEKVIKVDGQSVPREDDPARFKTEWIEEQVRMADQQTHIVGKCKDCGHPVYEVQEYNYSDRDNWVQHAVEEDCDMTGQTVGACVPPTESD